MSAWSYSTKVDLSGLLELMGNIENIPAFMLEVAEEVAEHVRENIVSSDIIDTGALLDSIAADQPNEYITTVHDGVEYGVYQEFGAPRNNLAARPFFIPALEMFGSLFDSKFTELLK